MKEEKNHINYVSNGNQIKINSHKLNNISLQNQTKKWFYKNLELMIQLLFKHNKEYFYILLNNMIKTIKKINKFIKISTLTLDQLSNENFRALCHSIKYATYQNEDFKKQSIQYHIIFLVTLYFLCFLVSS
ncbi:unnamed protein product [Paramecium sonneborni]|uniref:Transmembrane protein n=1 Tax=Paramecium sonneborni TaxID=65129 RepID=A0A8S1M842_9CILI|nr:unnamed protein product [Paramecium sonneborni]